MNITRLSYDEFEAPDSVLQTAVTPISSRNLTTVSYDPPSNYASFNGYYAVLHMVELQNLSFDQSRQYDIYINDQRWYNGGEPSYLEVGYVYDQKPLLYSHYVFDLVQLSNSTLPPILNGMEVYWPMSMEVDQMTSANDRKKSSLLLQNKKKISIFYS